MKRKELLNVDTIHKKSPPPQRQVPPNSVISRGRQWGWEGRASAFWDHPIDLVVQQKSPWGLGVQTAFGTNAV